MIMIMKHKKEDDHDGDHFHSDESIVTIYLSLVNNVKNIVEVA